jgi:hypothetical protein
MNELRPALQEYLAARAEERRSAAAMQAVIDDLSFDALDAAEAKFDRARQAAVEAFEMFFPVWGRVRWWPTDEAEQEATSQACLSEFEEGSCSVVLRTSAPSDADAMPESDAIDARGGSLRVEAP